MNSPFYFQSKFIAAKEIQHRKVENILKRFCDCNNFRCTTTTCLGCEVAVDFSNRSSQQYRPMDPQHGLQSAEDLQGLFIYESAKKRTGMDNLRTRVHSLAKTLVTFLKTSNLSKLE